MIPYYKRASFYNTFNYIAEDVALEKLQLLLILGVVLLPVIDRLHVCFQVV